MQVGFIYKYRASCDPSLDDMQAKSAGAWVHKKKVKKKKMGLNKKRIGKDAEKKLIILNHVVKMKSRESFAPPRISHIQSAAGSR